MLSRLKADAAAYQSAGIDWRRNTGFWVTANYRLGRWAFQSAPNIVKKPLVHLHRLSSLPIRFLLGVEISREADIGEGLIIVHPRDIQIPAGATLGPKCVLYHSVTLGAAFGTTRVPQLEGGVVVFPGARILGDITIGAHAEIGANCVVTRDLPPGSALSVAPARTIPKVLLDASRHAQ